MTWYWTPCLTKANVVNDTLWVGSYDTAEEALSAGRGLLKRGFYTGEGLLVGFGRALGGSGFKGTDPIEIDLYTFHTLEPEQA